jgi:hypothetical protein
VYLQLQPEGWRPVRSIQLIGLGTEKAQKAMRQAQLESDLFLHFDPETQIRILASRWHALDGWVIDGHVRLELSPAEGEPLTVQVLGAFGLEEAVSCREPLACVAGFSSPTVIQAVERLLEARP